MTAYLRTNMDVGQGTRGVDVYMMVDGGVEWGGEEGGVVIEVLIVGDEAEKVSTDKVVFRDPDLFTMLIEDVELVGVLVLDVSTGRGFEEMGEECGIGLVHRWDRGDSKYVRGRWCWRWDGGDWCINNGGG